MSTPTTPILQHIAELTRQHDAALSDPARRAQLPSIRAALQAAWDARRRELQHLPRSASEDAANIPNVREGFRAMRQARRPRQ